MDQLGEMNQSIDTLASSSAANQSSRGKFLKTTLFRPLTFTMQLFCFTVQLICHSWQNRRSLIQAPEFTQLVKKELFFLIITKLLLHGKEPHILCDSHKKKHELGEQRETSLPLKSHYSY